MSYARAPCGAFSFCKLHCLRRRPGLLALRTRRARHLNINHRRRGRRRRSGLLLGSAHVEVDEEPNEQYDAADRCAHRGGDDNNRRLAAAIILVSVSSLRRCTSRVAVTTLLLLRYWRRILEKGLINHRRYTLRQAVMYPHNSRRLFNGLNSDIQPTRTTQERARFSRVAKPCCDGHERSCRKLLWHYEGNCNVD